MNYLGEFNRKKPANPQSEIHSRKLTGLGDAVALVAKPIARVIDKIAGTKLESCQPCAKRQARLNALVPFSGPPAPP